MIRSILLACSLLLAAPIASAESDPFDARVRQFLLENPEVIIEALEVLSTRQARDVLVQKLADRPELFSDAPLHGLGAPGAPIRVIEFFDYKCAPCKAMHPELKQLVAANPNLRIEMLHLPILSPGSERAARFALATRAVEGSAAYKRVHDRLWDLRGPMNATGFARIAAGEGLDFAAIEAEMESEAITGRINRNRDVAIALEISGTPAFITRQSVHFGQSDIADLAALWLSQ